MDGTALLRPIQALYEAYIEKTRQLERDKKLGDGWMGLKPGPKDDPCHGQFARDLEQALAALLAAEPSSVGTREVLAYIYRAPKTLTAPLTATWMFQAVHGLTAPLISRLDAADAQALRDEYKRLYRRWDRLPTQKKTLDALEKAAGQ